MDTCFYISEDYRVPNPRWQNVTLRYFVHPQEGVRLNRNALYYVAGLALQVNAADLLLL